MRADVSISALLGVSILTYLADMLNGNVTLVPCLYRMVLVGKPLAGIFENTLNKFILT
jgi:hypothetical protein